LLRGKQLYFVRFLILWLLTTKLRGQVATTAYGVLTEIFRLKLIACTLVARCGVIANHVGVP
jgi:hypothetical protein